MTDKIVQFPAGTTRSVPRITAYRPNTRAETLIAVWLCGWALLTAAECVRQINKAWSFSTAQPSQPAKAPIYVALARPINENASCPSARPRESCNFSRSNCVLWLN
jgi:hypothetical protein